MILGMSHLALKVENMEKSLHFYCDLLGFQHAFDIKDKNDQPWIEYVKVGTGQFIELFHDGKNKQEELPDRIGVDHLCLEVTDIDDLAIELQRKGIEIDGKPRKALDNNYQFWIKDPDGNRIELMQIEKNSPQWKWYN